MDTAERLTKAINDQGALVLKYALVLVGVGTLAMAALELIKGLIKARRLYNRWSVQQWTAGNSRSLARLVGPSPPAKGGAAVLVELELLAAGGHDYTDSLYDQPVEKLMGEIQAAIHVALDFPDQYPHLYGFITTVSEPFKGSEAAKVSGNDRDVWKGRASEVRAARARAVAGVPAAPSDDTQEAGLARTRLTNLVSRRLDAFQVETQYFWDRLNQWASMILGAIIFAGAGMSMVSSDADRLLLLLLAIPAGIVAPFAKDLVSSLSSFGK